LGTAINTDFLSGPMSSLATYSGGGTMI